MTRGSTLPAHRLSHLSGRLSIPAQIRTSPAPVLDGFNIAPAEEAHRALLTCLRSLRWARRLADHRPYPTLDALLAASDEAAYDLTAGDLAEALAAESLPALPDDAYGAAHMALSAAHAAYEARFGHAFVICLDGIPADEALDHVLEAIRSRLTNDPEDERVVAAEELRRLGKARLVSYLRGAGL
ncbi:2-oxo-4-hydroxy-4-carboxy-5-ureidoimidazoline decarboxylase [Streptomyces soliscabiei]|uniref:2-oxo-4-hydroxy-4-carboxy-5-ureidoimidazoline decarboxylase n=1 Tax=Streptomyces soliscabiei TaxID=588897 RepID=UPI0029BC2624|nr:2-oxo-4-hydroxy-4-carboxy-5-ureidoimidazoline decarboxylase [Streptomyces sp. NY05-11A]MDX2675572.1 2-oxo-4-hydroxy-4-carboxy-5-ureidoimidazoline decarboxylase [Streptomyces sp. NY05-11A]